MRANHLRSLFSSCLLQIKYACAMIETGTRHTILICACTNHEKVAGILRTFHLSLHFKCETCAVTLGAHTYRTSKRVQDKGYHTKRQQESKVILTSPQHARPSSARAAPRAMLGFQISLVTLHAWPVRVNQRRREGSLRRPRGLSSPLPLQPPTLLWWRLSFLVVYTLSIVCILTTLTVSLLGVTRSSTI
jgi:hypothetical protein